MQIIPEIAARREALVAIRHDIHSHPELGFEETRTAALVAAELASHGIEVHTGIGKTGVVGVIRRGTSDACIALRADMDALPIEEAGEGGHRSRHAGRMHACGHDGHTTMLLGAAAHLAAHGRFDGTLVLVFQPAEEGRGGAPAMIRDGFFERFPVQQVYGMHNWPGMPLGHFGVTPGAVMASADRFDIVVTGHGGHAAMPHLSIDPLVAGAALVTALQSVVSRNTDPLDSAVVTVTRFHAGDAYNVIPHTAKLCGTTRALRHEVREATWKRIQRVCAGVAEAYGVKIEARMNEGGYPPTINTPDEAAVCREVASDLVGAERVEWGIRPSMGAEDFSFFLEQRPGCYVWIGNGPGEGGCTLHNPRYDFNDDALTLGASYWVRLAERLLPAA